MGSLQARPVKVATVGVIGCLLVAHPGDEAGGDLNASILGLGGDRATGSAEEQQRVEPVPVDVGVEIEHAHGAQIRLPGRDVVQLAEIAARRLGRGDQPPASNLAPSAATSPNAIR
jgi:hypothetical protein